MSSFLHHWRRRLLPTALLSMAVVVLVGATDDTTRFREVGHRLMCVCGCGQVLLECNHVGCQYSDRMRNELLTGLERGDNDDLTLQSFVQKYGPTVLAAPPTTGFNRMAWVTPYAMLLLATTIAVLTIRTWRLRAMSVSRKGPAPIPGSNIEAFRDQIQKETEL